jgi:endonuclease/exonuclease/phosphatase (EEP) superfamily protein YafD
MLFYFGGDRWWFATLLLFGPRWVYGIPIAVLAPLALVWQRWCLLPVAVSAVIVVGPIMGFNVPWGGLGRPADVELRVLSYNIERWNVTPSDFAAVLHSIEPALVVVQECPSRRWPLPEKWHVQRAGELIVASIYPIRRVEISHCRWPPRDNPSVNGIYCVLATPRGEIGFCNLHLDTPRRGLSAVLDREQIINLERVDYAEMRIEYRRRESEELARWLSGFPEPKIIAGDFNMPVDSRIYRESWASRTNAFDQSGWGLGYTKQTVIRRQKYGLRIDHVLIDGSWGARRCWVGPDLGSDHLPVIADLYRN